MPDSRTPSRRAARVLWPCFTLALFTAALAATHRGFWGSDLTREVPIPRDRAVGALTAADYRVSVWATSRNARAILEQPTALFDAEPCHPEPGSLTKDHPILTLGLLGVPVWLATGDPVATFNGAHFLQVLIAALAMILLVADWTRSPPAGIAAGLLYGFHGSLLDKPFHLQHTDGAWLLFALFFARRLVEGRRVRDAVGLGAALALQMGSSFYAFLAATFAGLPPAVWLSWRGARQREGRARLAALLLLAGAIAAAGAAYVFTPYLGRAGAEKASRHFFEYWSVFAPGGRVFPGFLCLALAACALALGRRRATPDIGGDPRIPLLLGALCVALVATGGNHRAQMDAFRGNGPVPFVALPNPYLLLRGVVPGLDSVRLVSDLAEGARQMLCVLAGLGAAALLRSAPPRLRPHAAAGLVALAFAASAGPSLPGVAPESPFRGYEIAPREGDLAFFAELASLGNDGPMLEVPVRSHDELRVELATQHWLTAYHRRRTSGCFGSRQKRKVAELESWSRRVPAGRSFDFLRGLGFTTVVVHHRDRAGRSYLRSVERAARQSQGRLERIASSDTLTAFALR